MNYVLIVRDSDQILQGRLIPTGSRNRFTAAQRTMSPDMLQQHILGSVFFF